MKIGAAVLAVALVACSAHADSMSKHEVYPLGPFARVAHWSDVLDRTPQIHSEIVDGRHFYGVGKFPGGYPGLTEMASGPVGPRGPWVLALPLVSGGSGGVFTILVFEMKGTSPHFVGAISDGDRLRVQIANGAIQVIVPTECLSCADDFRIIDYHVAERGLVRGRVHTVKERKLRARSYLIGSVESVFQSASKRYARIRLSRTDVVTDAIDDRAGVNADARRRVLVVQYFEPSLANVAPSYGQTIESAYSYEGGLQM